MTTFTESERPSKSPLFLRLGFWVCVVIGCAVVILRILALARPSANRPPQMAALDAVFASHAALTLAHIIPAIIFVLVAPFAVFARFSRLKWPLRILFPLGAIVGLTAYAMNVYAVGGWTERIVIIFFNTFFLYSLARSFRYGRLGQPALQRRWLLRSIAIVLGVATARPVMGIFFATSPLTHLQPSQFFGIAMAVGFSVNVLVFELWIRTVDRRQQSQSLTAASDLTAPARP